MINYESGKCYAVKNGSFWAVMIYHEYSDYGPHNDGNCYPQEPRTCGTTLANFLTSEDAANAVAAAFNERFSAWCDGVKKAVGREDLLLALRQPMVFDQ